jgi:polysaccharide export outer membrane protein
VALSACASSGGTSATVAPPTGAEEVPLADANLDYRLGSGDKLRVIVFGEQDLSGEFDVTGSGKVSLPLIGQVQAAGKTVNEFAEEVGNELKQGYLTNPKISIEVLNYRPFYIIGEVVKPGQYPYTNGMTALNAVAVAGGYTYRANHDRVFITRGNASDADYPADQSVRVLPGDIVRIPERFF